MAVITYPTIIFRSNSNSDNNKEKIIRLASMKFLYIPCV